jgi:hypothetical protein
MDNHNFSQWLSNLVGGGTLLATWIGFLPTISAVIASIIAGFWYIIQIYESETVRRWMAGRRVRKLARLKARVLMMEAQAKVPLPGPESGGAALH